jgi:hypothetical protein
MDSTPSPTPLTRSSTDRELGGVAAGLARHPGIGRTAVVPSDDATPAAASPTAA